MVSVHRGLNFQNLYSFHLFTSIGMLVYASISIRGVSPIDYCSLSVKTSSKVIGQGPNYVIHPDVSKRKFV